MEFKSISLVELLGLLKILIWDRISLPNYKNGHILPTGQWYAPSAVINDALVVHILHILHILVWSDHHMTS